MRVLDLFAGTGSGTQAFRDDRHEVVSVEYDQKHPADLHADISTLTAADLIELGTGGRYDMVWASPPCTAFSVASGGYHWTTKGRERYIPRTDVAKQSLALVAHVVELINTVTAHDGYFAIENPRGMLRKMEPVMWLHRDTIWYCQYGDTRAKPTDLWNNLPDTWHALTCHNGNPDHDTAPRGATTGNQGLCLVDRSKVPLGVSRSILDAINQKRDAR